MASVRQGAQLAGKMFSPPLCRLLLHDVDSYRGRWADLSALIHSGISSKAKRLGSMCAVRGIKESSQGVCR